MPLKNLELLVFKLIALIDSLSFAIILPCLPYFAMKFGATPLEITGLTAIYYLGFFISVPIIGYLIDKQFIEKKLLLFTINGIIFSYVVLLVSKNVFLIYVARFIMGLMSGNLCILQVAITNLSKKEELTENFAALSVFGNIGDILGMGMCISLPFIFQEDLVYQNIFLFSIIINFLISFALIKCVRRSIPKKNQVQKVQDFSWKNINLNILSYLFFNFSLMSISSVLPLLVYEKFGFTTQALAALFLLYIMVGTLAQKLVLRGSIENNKLAIVLSCYSLCFISCMLFEKANSPIVFIILCIIFSVGVYLLSPLILFNIASSSLNSGRTGVIMGISDCTKALATIVASISSGFLYQNYSENIVFYTSGALLLLSFFFYISYSKPYFLFRKIYDK